MRILVFVFFLSLFLDSRAQESRFYFIVLELEETRIISPIDSVVVKNSVDFVNVKLQSIRRFTSFLKSNYPDLIEGQKFTMNSFSVKEELDAGLVMDIQKMYLESEIATFLIEDYKFTNEKTSRYKRNID